jgi:hypothetical protein
VLGVFVVWLLPVFGQASVLEAKLQPYLPEVLIARPLDLQAFEGEWLIAAKKEARTYAVDPVSQKKRVVVDLSDRIGGRGNEEGLLAIEPTAKPLGLLVYGSRQKPRRTVLSWLPYDPDGKIFLRQQEKVILQQPQFASNHNGGDILRLPDGTYLLGFGDGGRAGDPKRHGQNPKTWLGSIIRIAIDLETGAYQVPQDNPLTQQDFAAPETWAFGLRNPWRFDLAPDGSVWIGDVGQNEWEEVTIATPGSNHGWRVFEGFEHFKPSEEPLTPVTEPAFVYGHDRKGGYSITGGVFVRNPQSIAAAPTSSPIMPLGGIGTHAPMRLGSQAHSTNCWWTRKASQSVSRMTRTAMF